MSDESSELVLSEAKQEMQKSLTGLVHDLSKVRTGRANPALLEGLQVDYYGTPTPLKKLAQLNAPEARLITEDRRKDLARQVKKLGEDHKVGVRNARRDAIAMAKELQKDGDLGEDDARHLQDKIQKLTDDFVAQIDKAVDAKEAELMKV